jgi:hypothetical protein
MKLLFNLEVIKGNRIKANPSDYLKSLPVEQQITAVTEFLGWAENAARTNEDLQARAEAEIGVATAREFLQKLEDGAVRIYTGSSNSKDS